MVPVEELTVLLIKVSLPSADFLLPDGRADTGKDRAAISFLISFKFCSGTEKTT